VAAFTRRDRFVRLSVCLAHQKCIVVDKFFVTFYKKHFSDQKNCILWWFISDARFRFRIAFIFCSHYTVQHWFRQLCISGPMFQSSDLAVVCTCPDYFYV